MMRIMPVPCQRISAVSSSCTATGTDARAPARQPPMCEFRRESCVRPAEHVLALDLDEDHHNSQRSVLDSSHP